MSSDVSAEYLEDVDDVQVFLPIKDRARVWNLDDGATIEELVLDFEVAHQLREKLTQLLLGDELEIRVE